MMTMQPELAVKIVGPHDYFEDVLDTVCEYLRGGVRLFMIVSPKHRQVYVYNSLDRVRIFNATDTLDGGDVLPGFKVNVGSLFPPVQFEPLPST